MRQEETDIRSENTVMSQIPLKTEETYSMVNPELDFVSHLGKLSQTGKVTYTQGNTVDG